MKQKNFIIEYVDGQKRISAFTAKEAVRLAKAERIKEARAYGIIKDSEHSHLTKKFRVYVEITEGF